MISIGVAMNGLIRALRVKRLALANRVERREVSPRLAQARRGRKRERGDERGRA
ncbi:hypothetical protein GCM10023174_01530 [Chelativorans composti]|jgi:hypothetical protein